MRHLYAVISAGLIIVLPSLAASAPETPKMDDDTVCAAIYTHAAKAARAYGMESAGFEASALKAERAHMAVNPREDWQRYIQSVNLASINLETAMANRSLSTDDFMASAAMCNARYDVATPITQSPRS